MAIGALLVAPVIVGSALRRVARNGVRIGLQQPTGSSLKFWLHEFTRNGKADLRAALSIYAAFGATVPTLAFAADAIRNRPWDWTSPNAWLALACAVGLVGISWFLGRRNPSQA